MQTTGIESDSKLEQLQGRLEGQDGLKGQEKTKQQHKLARGEKVKQVQGISFFQVGIYDAIKRREQNPRHCCIRKISVKKKLLTQTAFNEYPRKTQQIRRTIKL